MANFLVTNFIMVQLSKFLNVAAACLTAPVLAHPGEKHDPDVLKREINARDAMTAAAKRSLCRCENTLHARELAKRNVARRSRSVQQLRKKRGVTTSKCSYVKSVVNAMLNDLRFSEMGSQLARS